MRRIPIVFSAMSAAVLLTALTAWACTNLASLNLASAAGQAGERIELTGTSFATTAQGGSAVSIRWDRIDGQVLATVEPDAVGSVAATVRIPSDATAGAHVMIATQEYTNSDGLIEPAYGTPARAGFLVGDIAPTSAVQDAPAVTAVPVDSGTNGGLIALTILLTIGGLGLFAAGVGLFAREVRGRGAVRAPVDKE